MFFDKIRLILLQLYLLPTFLLSQTTTDTVDTALGTDGASAAGSGMWWFWVALLLAIVGLAIWWASKTSSPPTNIHPPKNT
jgi:hypothetical protein